MGRMVHQVQVPSPNLADLQGEGQAIFTLLQSLRGSLYRRDVEESTNCATRSACFVQQGRG